MSKVKSLKTEDIKKFEDVKVFTVRIEITGISKVLFFKSKELRKLTNKVELAKRLHGNFNVMSDSNTFTVKNTAIYCDENHSILTIASLKGDLI